MLRWVVGAVVGVVYDKSACGLVRFSYREGRAELDRYAISGSQLKGFLCLQEDDPTAGDLFLQGVQLYPLVAYVSRVCGAVLAHIWVEVHRC